MPYYQKQQSKPYKSASRFAKYKQCGSMIARDAARALSMARYVKSLINVEYKSIRQAWTTDPNTTGDVISLSDIPGGTAFNQRTGRKVKLVSIQHKGSILLHASATNTFGRHVVVRDNLGDTTAPTIADLFGSATNMLNNLSRLDDPQTNSQFTVLYDKWYTLNSNTQEQKQINSYKKTTFHVTFTGTAATDEGKGNVYLMSVSSESTNDPVVNVVTTIKYIDN